jgi:hypothetical protein
VPSGTRRFFRAAGVLRLESEALVALLRTSKLGRNTLFGGPVGGGSLVYLADRAGGANRLRVDRESPVVEGNFTLYPARAQRRAALIRYFGLNPPGREGRQWLFVARLLLARRRPLAAATRFWRGYLQPLARSLGDPVASHWAIASDVNLEDESVRIACRPARADGSVPRWASAVAVTRAYDLPGDRLHVSESVRCEDRSGPSPIGRVLYLLPRAARDVQFESSERVGRRGTGGRRLELRPTRGEFWLRVTYNM